MKKLGILVLWLGIALCTTGLIQAQDLQITPSQSGWTPIGSGNFLGTYLYGDVVVGESGTATFTFESMGPSAVWVYQIGLVESMTLDDPSFTTPNGMGLPWYTPPPDGIWDYTLGAFSFAPDDWIVWRSWVPPSGAWVPLLPQEMPEGEIFTLDVTFTPTNPGVFDVYLFCQSNDSVGTPGLHSFIHLEGLGVEAAAVPEPTSLLLLGSGIGVIGLAAWRRRK